MVILMVPGVLMDVSSSHPAGAGVPRRWPGYSGDRRPVNRNRLWKGRTRTMTGGAH